MGKNRDFSKFPNAITVLDNGNVGINTSSPDSLYNLTTVRSVGSSGNIKLIGDTTSSGSPTITFYNNASSTAASISWTGTGFNMGTYLNVNGGTMYSPLNVNGAGVSWGENATFYPASNGYITLTLRLEGSTGTTTTGAWAIGKESSTGGNTSTQYLQVVKNGLTGSSLHRADAVQAWDTNGNTYIGYRLGIGTNNAISSLHVNGGKIIHTSDSGSYGQFQINSSSTSVEATILLSNGGSGVNNGNYTNAGVIGMGAYGNARDTLVFGTGYNGGTLFLKDNTVTVSGTVVNSGSYKSHTFIQLTSSNYATKTFSWTGNPTGSFAVTDFGLPSNTKALQVYGWYHINGYGGAGSGQGDHAACWFGASVQSDIASWGSPGAPWPNSAGSFQSRMFGSFVLWHDGDASNGNLNYYGFMDNGIITVNSNGNIYYNLGHGYSGGTHYVALYVTGYWI